MSLADDIRNGVAQAAAAVGALLVTVQHEVKTGDDSDGKPTYADPVARQAFVMTAQAKVARQMGEEVVTGPTVLFVGNVIIAVQDRLTMPNGDVVPITAEDGVADPAGGVYYAQAECGRPGRGTVTS